MQYVSELLEAQRRKVSGDKNKDVWADMVYNVEVYGAKGDGSANDTSDIQSAIDDAAENGGMVVFPPGTYVTSSLTVPSNVTLWFVNGALLSVNSGSTVTINGPIEAGLHQIFSGLGTVSGAPKIEYVLPQWFGAKADGVTDDTTAFAKSLLFFKTVKLPFTPGGYLVGSLTITDGQSLIGDEQKTIIWLKAGTDWLTIHGTNIAIKNLRILANNMTGSLFLIDTLNLTCTYLYFENIFAYQATTILKDNGGTNQITSLYVRTVTSSLQKGNAYVLTKAEAFTFFQNVVVDYATAGAGNNFTAFSLSNNNGSIFENCDVLGSASTGANTNQIAYKFTSCQAVWLKRCSADTMDGNGFHITGASSYFYLDQCVGSLCSGHQFYIEQGTDIKFTNCYAGGRKGFPSALANRDGINLQSAANKVIISATRITSCTRDGIRIDGAAFTNAMGVNIDNNDGYAIRTTGTSTGMYSNLMSLGNASGNYDISSAFEFIRHIYKGDATMGDTINGPATG